MKTNTSLVLSALAFVVSCGQHCAGQTNVLFYGADSNVIGVAFVDTNLLASDQLAVVLDLQVCLSEWGKNSELRLRDKGDSVGYLDFASQCPHYPGKTKFPKEVTNSSSGLALRIPKELSDAYTNAFAFAAANSNIVAAAYEFVSFVSSSNFVSTVTSNTIHNYILVKGATSQYYQAEFEGIMEGLFQYPRYYPPSLLGFYYFAIGPETNNLYVALPAKTDPGYGHVGWVGLPAIWHENKWKVCLGYEREP